MFIGYLFILGVSRQCAVRDGEIACIDDSRAGTCALMWPGSTLAVYAMSWRASWIGVTLTENVFAFIADLMGYPTFEFGPISQFDHLVPLPKNHPDRDSELNRVVACNGCNGMKASFDPSGRLLGALNEPEMKTFIDAARTDIEKKRTAKHATYRSHGGTP